MRHTPPLRTSSRLALAALAAASVLSTMSTAARAGDPDDYLLPPVEPAVDAAPAPTPVPSPRVIVQASAAPCPSPCADDEPKTLKASIAKNARGEDEWLQGARFFGGVRGAVAVPPGGDGPAPMAGLELGVAAHKGVGFGLHVFGANNTPDAPTFELPAAEYAFGAAADFRYYLPSVEPLRLYPTLSLGFLAGPAEGTGRNAVLPLINPGFGARVNLGPVYVCVELGAASFYIPYIATSIGWEPERFDG